MINKDITLRAFTELNDAEIGMILEWRNHQEVRRWMRNDALISPEDHRMFIKNLENSDNKFYWLVFAAGLPIGVISLTKLAGEIFEGGLYKNPNERRRFGPDLIALLENCAMELNASRIVLSALRQNKKAQQLYFDCGYCKYAESDDEILMRKYLTMEACTPKTVIVAELSANHNHNIDIALNTITAMAETGADAVKIQTYTADTITLDADTEYFRIKQGTIWDGRTLYDLYNEASTPWDWHDTLKARAESLGMVFFSSPFDKSAVDFLEDRYIPMYKIASFEITDIPLIEYVAAKGKPVIISTGIATIGEIQEAVDACFRAGNQEVTLLKCTSSYPAPVEQANLRTMENMGKTFGVGFGLSDHTMGSDVAIAATALGATLVEKHFILDRNVGGPDSSFSMEPAEFAEMVRSIRNVEAALGSVSYLADASNLKSRAFSRSLFVIRDVDPGEPVSLENVRSIRPGNGLPPKYLAAVLGRKFASSQKKGMPLSWAMLAPEEKQ
jgi:pseudaminic acid synthase